MVLGHSASIISSHVAKTGVLITTRTFTGRVYRYWACVPCNLAKGNKWPTPTQRRKGYRLADSCREQDYGVHFVEDAVGKLVPQTPCGEYHIVALQLNRDRLQELRLLRNQKQTRLNDALVLQQELERSITPQSDAEAEAKRRLLAFVQREIEYLQAELAVSIPFISLQNTRNE
jgi:hypothetical protein